MTIPEYTQALGEATRHGWGFLFAYGATWLVCGVLWHRASQRTAAYATLFQGMVALPVALALTALTSQADRPELEGMDMLSVLLSAGQLLALPLVIFLVATRRYTDVPLAMAIVLVVHFAPYSWLYATPLYLIMGAAVAVGVTAAMGLNVRPDLPEEHRATIRSGWASLITGFVLVVSAGAAWFL
ncbi:hypothetical protein [Microbacterium sp. MPKO10]|uniref:DUF7010 family protein n=1 Tax=Microbacterium sp. MPKO10 TaxID=2989818 RepID=UPI0022366257|nr:hypothetical protein [Microbacterium sp. MPKO10]MCW4459622.1 hypothetical protein [Microbacterium sp. MPKO10]